MYLRLDRWTSEFKVSVHVFVSAPLFSFLEGIRVAFGPNIFTFVGPCAGLNGDCIQQVRVVGYWNKARKGTLQVIRLRRCQLCQVKGPCFCGPPHLTSHSRLVRTRRRLIQQYALVLGLSSRSGWFSSSYRYCVRLPGDATICSPFRLPVRGSMDPECKT